MLITLATAIANSVLMMDLMYRAGEHYVEHLEHEHHRKKDYEGVKSGVQVELAHH